MSLKQEKINIILESIAIAYIVFITLYMGFSDVLDNRLVHEYPQGYFATDGLYHEVIASNAYEKEDFFSADPSLVGGFDRGMISAPPLMYLFSVMLSNITGASTYDTLYHLIIFLVIFSIMSFYIIVRKFNKEIALLTLPLSSFLFINAFYRQIIWGKWLFITGSFLFIISLMIWTYRQEIINQVGKIAYIFFSTIVLSAMILAHVSEWIFFVIYILIYLAVKFLKEKRFIYDFKLIIIPLLLSVIISTPYLYIFVLIWLIPTMSQNNFGLITNSYNQMADVAIFMNSFSYFQYIIILGILFSAYLIYKKKNNYEPFVFIVFIFMFTNVISLGYRSFQMRYFWPIYYGFALALGIYLIIELLRSIKKFEIKYWQIFILFSVLCGLIFMFFNPIKSQGLLNKDIWDATLWLSKNTPNQSKTLIFYGDANTQPQFWAHSKNNIYTIDIQSYIQTYQSGTINLSPKSHHLIIEGHIPYWESHSIKFYAKELVLQESNRNSNICNYEYYVFDLKGQIQQLIQLNLAYRNMLLQSGNQEVYYNPQISIIKNNIYKGDCIILQNQLNSS